LFPQFEALQLNNDDIRTTLGKSFLFDVNTGDFILKNGKLQAIEGIEALKVWIQKILKTEKFKFKVYETGEINEYGVTLLELVNSGYPHAFIQAEIQREIAEALDRNPEILAVNNFSFTREKRTLIAHFNVNSIYGTVEQEVKF
jgi:hypothetical protein